jgi:hypothetical protein
MHTGLTIAGALLAGLILPGGDGAGAEPPPSTKAVFPRPYSPPCVERDDVFEFTEKPTVRQGSTDKYEITFAVKGNCDATVGIVNSEGKMIRHLGSGVLGSNAPAPFTRNSLKQTLHWDGKDDLGEYVKEPDKLKVRVMLGLKPQFDRLLGVSHPKNIAGFIQGIVVDETGGYIWTRGGTFSHTTIRKYDLGGNYLMSLTPPPSSLPDSRLGGRTSIEYEPGKRSHHAPLISIAFCYEGSALPGIGARGVIDIAPVIVDRRMYFCNAGPGWFSGSGESTLYYIYSDGSSDAEGLAGVPFLPFRMGGMRPRFAASPDGKWIYVSAVGSASHGGTSPVIMRYAIGAGKPAEPFAGKSSGKGKFDPASDNEGFNSPCGIDCDAQGRLYVADSFNNRVQVFSPEGKYLKTIPADRPREICVHKKTGGIYLQHQGVVQGRSVDRLTKFRSFDDPREDFHVDGIAAASMALDSWSPKPRIWLGGGVNKSENVDNPYGDHKGSSVIIYEEEGGRLNLLSDFDAEMKQLGGENYIGRWSNGVADHVNCDPVREHLYYQAYRRDPWIFDLKTGRKIAKLHMPTSFNDIAFDKHGYLHVHLDPGFGTPGVVRLDPGQSTAFVDHLGRTHKGVLSYQEVPYDYGIEHKGFAGLLPVKDQPGAKYFQDGFGVDMRGNIAENCNIYFVPKMEEDGWALADSGRAMREKLGQGSGPGRYGEFLRSIQDRQKQGEEVYSIRRIPGIPLAGATIWTFKKTGELQQECAAITTRYLVGTQVDEDGYLYFGTSNGKLIDGKPFLHERGSNLGTDKPFHPANRTPATYTYVKARPQNVRWILKNAPVPLEPLPASPPDIISWGPFGSPESPMWVEGVEWLYAGYSPGVAAGCTCPSSRAHLDWFKRSYIPEAYRHSIAVVDTAGNLIMHLGRYGNMDDVLKTKAGSDDIPLTLPRFISGTDNYLAFEDWGERLVVLKLNYHAEESAEIGGR